MRARNGTMMGIAPTDSTAVVHRHDTRGLRYKRARRTRVLIVEDDPALRDFVALLLTEAGFETDVASNGQVALDKAHDNPPRVIVLDMMMPVMDGWAFRAHQRCSATLSTIPVVILSAVPLAHLGNVGAAAALQKPFHENELVATIRAYC